MSRRNTSGFEDTPSGRALAVVARVAADAEEAGIELDWSNTAAAFDMDDAVEIADRAGVWVCEASWPLIVSTMRARGRQQRR